MEQIQVLLQVQNFKESKMTNRLARNTRVKELKEMLASETDPDKIEILEFDLMEAMGRKTTKPVKRRNGSPKTGEVAGNLNKSERDLIESLGPMKGNLSIEELLALARAGMKGNLNTEELKTLKKSTPKKRVRRNMGSPKTGEVAKSPRARGGGAAIAGMNFKGVF
jgi:hypothetical protein